MKINKTSKMVYMSLLVSFALVLSLIERSMPVPIPVPGAKIGLANLIIIIAIYTLPNYKDAFIILILKIFLSSLLGGNMSSMLYSACGGLLSFVATISIKELGKNYVSLIGVSVVGSFFHNVGQLLVASLILENMRMFLYLPALSFISIITGIFIGLSAYYILNHFNRINYFKNNLPYSRENN